MKKQLKIGDVWSDGEQKWVVTAKDGAEFTCEHLTVAHWRRYYRADGTCESQHDTLKTLSKTRAHVYEFGNVRVMLYGKHVYAGCQKVPAAKVRALAVQLTRAIKKGTK